MIRSCKPWDSTASLQFMDKFIYILMLSLLCLSLYGKVVRSDDFRIHASRIHHCEIILDGDPQEEAWQKAEAITDFIQCEPDLGKLSTENTIIKIIYDEDNLYIGAICYYKDMRDLVANNLAHRNLAWDDCVYFILDTFQDNIKGYLFGTNAFGAKDDGFVDGPSMYNQDWDEVWYVKTKINNTNWTAEFQIPLRILRFSKARKQTWGFNVLRRLRKKNERCYWTTIHPQHTITQLNLAGQIVGLEDLKPKRNLQVRPYLLMGRSEDKEDLLLESKIDFGFDVKYVPYPNWAMDVTYNTDFAQIESDDEQINLTRFSLFYPEKRDFFLENAQLFAFGMPGKIQPFFSRRIGIHVNQPVPILLGGRMTGKLGKTNVGLLHMATEKINYLESTHYTVLRFRQDVFKNSSIGFILTNMQNREGYNRTWGVDSEIWLNENSKISGFLSTLYTKEIEGNQAAGALSFRLDKDLFGLGVGYVGVGKHYDPQMGFVIMNNIHDYSGILRLSKRPGKWGIRKVSFSGWFDWTYTQSHEDFMRQNGLQFLVQLESGDNIAVTFNNIFENLFMDFPIFKDVVIPMDGYTSNNVSIGLGFAGHRWLSGGFSFQKGSFYDGIQWVLAGDCMIKVNKHLMVSNGIEYNDIDLPWGDFNTFINRLRINVIFNSNFSLKTYFQYNSVTRQINTNIRLHLLHGRDNDLYLVYNHISWSESGIWRKERNTAAIKANYRIYL